MKLTKLEHSGLLIEENGVRIVCDPVEFERKLPGLNNIAAIIITHKHNDHYQPEILQKIVADNPDVRIFAPHDIGTDEIGGRTVEKVAANTELNLENFNLEFFSKDHAEIVAGQVPRVNLGVVINDSIVNPGDSFDLPTGIKNIELLCVPIAAPWLKIPESMNYIKIAKPKAALPVHNALLSPLGEKISNNWLKNACDEIGVNYVNLEIGEYIEI